MAESGYTIILYRWEALIISGISGMQKMPAWPFIHMRSIIFSLICLICVRLLKKIWYQSHWFLEYFVHSMNLWSMLLMVGIIFLHFWISFLGRTWGGIMGFIIQHLSMAMMVESGLFILRIISNVENMAPRRSHMINLTEHFV